MGLYLAIFEGDDEVDGVDVGRYSDFSFFRNSVVERLEPHGAGSAFPKLILHSDCDGEWTADDAVVLERELKSIAHAFENLPPIPLPEGWQTDVAARLGLVPNNLLECFLDVDGELLVERLIGLARLSHARQLPILFQ